MKQDDKYASIICCTTLLLTSLTGCFGGGARGIVRFNELKYPASMSSYLYGPHNELLAKDRELMVIKRFRLELIYGAVLYSLVPPMDANDVGQQINAEVEACGGDGVVNLKISSHMGLTNYMHPLTLLPFLAGLYKSSYRGRYCKIRAVRRAECTDDGGI